MDPGTWIALGSALVSAVGTGVSMSQSTPKPASTPAPTEAAGTKSQGDVARRTQGRGLSATNLSGFRQMVSSYSGGKATLGAG